MSILRPLLLMAAVAGLAACGGDTVVGPGDERPGFVSEIDVVVNPSGRAPLAAVVSFTTTRPVSVEVTVAGRAGSDTDVRHRFEAVGQTWEIPVLGLYPSSANAVELAFFDAAGIELGTTAVSILAQALPPGLPRIEIDVAQTDEMAPGLNLVSYFGHDGDLTPQRPFMFDRAGAVRWVLDFRGHPQLGNLFFDNGVEALANGNLFFGDNNTSTIYEVDRLGNVLNTWAMPGFRFHHDVIEKPNGNFVATVTQEGAATVEDWIIEIDRATGAIVNTWDLRESLQQGRRALPTTFSNQEVDWIHVNAVIYDPSDDTIVLSGRTQGVVKLTADNEVVWILGPHRGWGRAGDGTDLNATLLQPLDAGGQPIADADVLDGRTPHPDFEWPWYQHAPLLLPDGTLLVFDNGDNRGFSESDLYSRAVGYRIDAGARTVQQVWEYGKARGEETFSRIVSDVDYHPVEDNVVFMPGAIQTGGRTSGKVIELDRESRRVVFEATLAAPTAPFGITFHRVERLPLYPSPSRGPEV